MKKLIGGLIILFISGNQVVSAQMENIIKGGKEDASYLVEGYAAPAIKAFASGLGQGWYNTADTHKFFGADLTISVSLIGVPSSEKNFTVDNSKMKELVLDQNVNGKGDVPTFFGSTKATNKTYSYTPDPNFPNIKETYAVPEGMYDLPIARVPVPVANIGLSLPKGIDLKFRYLPNIDLGDIGELGLFGAAIQHDIKQHIPGIKKLPFSMSVLVGYTQFKSTIVIDDSDPNNIQKSIFSASNTTMQVLVSKKISVLTVYGGVGYDLNKGDVKIKGQYDLGSAAAPNNIVTDPVSVSVTGNTARITAGLRLKFGPITLHGDYTQMKYSAITAGFGISVR